MLRKIHILVFIFMFGLFLFPTLAIACDTSSNTKESCCQNTHTSTTTKKDCCKKSKTTKKGCTGKCNETCRCVVHLHLNIITSSFVDKNISFNFDEKKQIFNYLKTDISSGFYAIWLPPVIG